MAKKSILALVTAFLSILAIIFIGCSSVTPAPEVKITSLSPVGLGGKDTILTIVFESKNKVDAVITTQENTLVGPPPTNTVIIPNPEHFTLYIKGNTTTTLTMTFTNAGIAALAASVGGSPTTLRMKFSGEDAYGYNKTFFDTCAVCF
jgi:hypothetical protein